MAARRAPGRVDVLSDMEDDCPVVVTAAMSSHKRPFIEVFAGSCHLSQAFCRAGHETWSMDIRLAADHDFSSESGPAQLLLKAKEFRAKHHMHPYIHFAPPCSTYSRARRPAIRSSTHPNGVPAKQLTKHERAILAHANSVTKRCFESMCALSDMGCPVSLEQPSGSLMLKTKVFKRWAHCSGAVPVYADYCQYGMPYRKRTQFWCAPGAFLQAMARKCPTGHKHTVTLSGWDYNPGRRMATSKGSSAYPVELCAEWVKAFDQHIF